MKKYVQLLRMKHYIKNLLIFIPLFFAQDLFCQEKFYCTFAGCIAFCFISSAVYILNDLKDIERDRIHVVKKARPIASGDVKIENAIMILVICVLLSIIINIFTGNALKGSIYVTGYFILNMCYSFGFKNKPLIDILILAAGFVIRILYGAMITDIDISGWLYLVVVMGAFYMSLGKRRNEMQHSLDTRPVLQYYTYGFLDKNMYVCNALLITFYALWAMEFDMAGMRWTIPVFIIILMRYSLDVEGDSDGDPVEVLIQDKVLIFLVFGYAIWLFLVLYFS